MDWTGCRQTLVIIPHEATASARTRSRIRAFSPRGVAIHVTPDNLLDLQRETTQVEQRRIWPWHHQEICVTGIGRVPAGHRTGHTHLAQATARRRCEGKVGLEPTIRG
jgi:hypothetical protein